MKLRIFLLASLTCALAFLGVGCGTEPPVVAGASQAPSDAPWRGPPDPNWNRPFDGDYSASYGDARANISFTPIEPRNLGNPAGILISRGDKARRGLGLIFDAAQYGRVIVVEGPLNVSEASYIASLENVVANQYKPNVSGSSEIVTIRGGVKALVTTPEDGRRSDIRWTENGIEIWIAGPNLNREAVIGVANGF